MNRSYRYVHIVPDGAKKTNEIIGFRSVTCTQLNAMFEQGGKPLQVILHGASVLMVLETPSLIILP